MLRRFLYYIPNVGGVNPRMIARHGLLSRFTGGGGVAGQLIEHGVTTSVDGPQTGSDAPRIGCIVAASSRPAKFDAAKQRWIAAMPTIGNNGGAFVGLEDASLPPGPADLERETGLDGYEIRLGDKNVWRVPLLQRWDPARLMHVSALPQSITSEIVDGQPRFVSKVRPEFDSIEAIAKPIFAGFCTKKRISLDELMRDSAALLAVNYRLGVEEIMLLGLLTEELALQVLGLAIDTPGLRDCGKKLGASGMIPRRTRRPADPPSPAKAVVDGPALSERSESKGGESNG